MGRRFGNRMRGWYTKRREYRPDYCKTVIAALDAWIVELGFNSETARGATRAVSYPVNWSVPQPTCKTKSQRAGNPWKLWSGRRGFKTLDPNLGKVVLYP